MNFPENYTIYHLHSQHSNGTTNIDSITDFKDYIKTAKECGMKAIAFSEHGNIFEWYHKKEEIEKAGMKYIHAVETYVTEKITWIDENGEEYKKRDNYHCVLIAKNFEGFKELNKLASLSFNRGALVSEEIHYYYAPRITIDELEHTSDNIIVCSACLGSILNKGELELKERFLNFFKSNSDRCFLEIQHHNVKDQIEYNQYLYDLSLKTGLRLIAGTDTHCLNEDHTRARKMLQQGKKVFFDGEDNWDLIFKTFEQLVESFEIQNSVPKEVYMQAIQNTNILSDMIETFDLDKSFKFPKISDNPDEKFRKDLLESAKKHKYLSERYPWSQIEKELEHEMEAYSVLKSSDYMNLETYLMAWCRKNNIDVGYGRGSVTGSLSAYALGITEMDSIKFGLKFWRFMHKDKYSAPDIDMDFAEEDRDKVKYFILNDHMNLDNINTAEIITFNTIALKGAIRDIGRGLGYPLEEVDKIAKAVHDITEGENKITVIDDIWRKKYPELFEYVDMVSGVIVSVGTHPSGVLVTDHNILEMIGVCSTKDSDYPVTFLNMTELDALGYVKLDILGLSNIGVINKTCKLANIERLTPDNVDLEDEKVWKSIRDDTSLCFQWNSNFGAQTMSKLFSDETLKKIKEQYPKMTYLDLFSFGNALIRPCGKGRYDDAVQGIVHLTGIKDIDDFLSPEMGNCIFQEDIMQFVMDFCGYTFMESDALRKKIAKKKGTKEALPEVKEGFYNNAKVRYGLSDEKANDIIEPILQCILDATRYSFSKNHAYAYSCIGYICGYLRYYYPLEFLAACLNTWKDDEKKTQEAMVYVNKKGIKVKEPRFRYGLPDYTFDKDANIIFKGMNSIKYLNADCSYLLYSLRDNKYEDFTELLYDIYDSNNKSKINARQIEILIKLEFFEEFGNAKELLRIYESFEKLNNGQQKSMRKSGLDENGIVYTIVKRNSSETDKTFTKINCKAVLKECEEYIRSQNIPDFIVKDKLKFQKEYLGYINLVTNKEEDRPKLIVLERRFMVAKTGSNAGKPWAVVVNYQSLGSGIRNSVTILYSIFQEEPFVEDDVIYCIQKPQKNKRGYWMLNSYQLCDI